MRFMSKIMIPGKITYGRIYKELNTKNYTGWLPVCDELINILIKNDEGLVSKFKRIDFIEIDKQRTDLIKEFIQEGSGVEPS
jgi:hypothetical protein